MSTVLRAELSTKNKYYIDRHRYYELKHFCLQYPLWKKAYLELDEVDIPLATIGQESINPDPSNPTMKRALMKVFYTERIKLIERTAMDTDPYLYSYILKGITEEKSYTYLKTVLGIPCGRDMYYDRYRKFFWLLSKSRE